MIYPKDFINKIITGDCLNIIKYIPDNSIDLIITSPPYNLKTGQHHTKNYKFKPYDNFNDNLEEEKYQNWQLKILNECFRTLKFEGSIFYNHKNRIQRGIMISPYEWILKSKLIVKQEIVWINGTPNFDKKRFYPFTERLYWLVKNKNTILNNQLGFKDYFSSCQWPPSGTKSTFKRAFPIQLPHNIISLFPKSKLVLDPFSGSGTTCCAAKLLGKNYIGIEISKNYCKLAENNLLKTNNRFSFFNK